MTSSTEPRARYFRWLGCLQALCLALLLTSCATFGPPPASEEERAAYREAFDQVQVDRDAGVAALEAFLERYPTSSLADDAAFELAELALEVGETEVALRHFRYVVDRHPDGDRANRAGLEAARLELQAGNEQAARVYLRGVNPDRLSREDRRTAYRVRADLGTDPADRLRWLARARALSDDDPLLAEELDAEIGDLLAQLSGEELAQAVQRLGNRGIGGRLLLEVLERALDSEDVDAAKALLAAAQEASLSRDDRKRLEQLEERYEVLELVTGRTELPSFAQAMKSGWRKPRPKTGTIGVVLPLSGDFARYGEASLRGVLLAAGAFESASLPAVSAAPPSGGDAGAGQGGEQRIARITVTDTEDMPGPHVVVRDTGGDPARAAAAVRELAERDDVVAIIGPLLGAECEAAAAIAEENEIPILTLTSRQEIPERGENVFRLRTTPDDEVHYLLGYAMEELGASRFAILYPKDAYGRGMRDRFWEAAEARGGHVLGVSSYEPGDVDFADSIREMIGYVLLTEKEREVLRQRTRLLERGRRLDPKVAAVAREVAYSLLGPEGDRLPPIVDFDALFIPDSHDKVVLIAPQLAFHELEDVQLLGSSGWDHPDLVRIARNHVRGAVVATPFHRESRFPFVSSFVEDYQTTFGSEPDSYSAHAYDAAQLIFLQLAKGRESREEVRDGVLEVSGYPGVSGVFTLLPDGNARKRPFLLRVRGGRFVSLD